MNQKARKLVNMGWIACLMLATGSTNARAVSLYSQVGFNKPSLGNGIVMGEFFNSNNGAVGYSFDIVSPGLVVNTFLISFQSDDNNLYTAPIGWAGQFVSKADWNEAPLYGSSSFDSWFGSTDDTVLILSSGSGMSESNDYDSTAWDLVSPQFTRYGAPPATEFVALGGGNAILGGSVIPEPGTALLAAFGGLALLRRKR